MFGYVRVCSPELKVKEYELYRGVYCGLCRSMGKCTGQCSRITLSYDFAFLALARVTLDETPIAFSQKRCLIHPLKKRCIMEHNPTLAYCAGAAALLNYHKIMDDLADERGGKKLRALLVRPWMAHARKRAIREGLGSLDASITEKLRRLAELERSETVSVDLPAEAFGAVLSDIFAHGLDGSRQRVASALGMAVGKWIYVADALDDWQKDAQKNRYNPFLRLYGNRLPEERELEGIRDALKNGLFDAEAALDLVEFSSPEIRNVLYNILYLGMPERIDKIRFAVDLQASAHDEERTVQSDE